MVIPNEGKARWLLRAINDGLVEYEPFYVRLYQNDYTPADASVESDFTEATFTGYAPVNPGGSDWEAPVVVANVAEMELTVAPSYECTGGSPQTVYGWYMVGTDSGIVYAAQRFNTPRVMVTGSVESLDPFKIKLKTFTA